MWNECSTQNMSICDRCCFFFDFYLKNGLVWQSVKLICSWNYNFTIAIPWYYGTVCTHLIILLNKIYLFEAWASWENACNILPANVMFMGFCLCTMTHTCIQIVNTKRSGNCQLQNGNINALNERWDERVEKEMDEIQ